MWIMLTQKLPTEVSPPKMSIFWAVPWPQSSTIKFDDPFFGMVPDYKNAMKIKYKGSDVRVYPHEFSELSDKNLQFYMNEEAIELVADSVAEEQLINGVLDGETRPIYEAAILDGCTHAQAMTVAFGGNPITNTEIPPIGWFRLKKEYAEEFCREEEMAG